ncbi:S26 family signal peptidase [uncultured Selenomonas sp.]|jgi:conjugal transfer protein traF|uniref:S26 family signal peptidase n=1 Tax=uncultured Selenomonas sp. TaxID=159275 RepID=UPI0028F06AEC|nr:S26 family signal peptidase [uncultured Selenomonas sp.]
MMLTMAAFGWRFPEQNIVFFNQTASVPVGFYVRVPDRPLARGDYVVYEMTEVTRRYAVARGYVTKPTEPFLKRVGAIAGDSYSIDAETRRFFIDGTYIGDVFERDRMERPLPQQEGAFIVSEGEFLPIGESTRSFDGRYTGTVPTSHIIAIVVPLLTWW